MPTDKNNAAIEFTKQEPLLDEIKVTTMFENKKDWID
jgi:hypothetical protein